LTQRPPITKNESQRIERIERIDARCHRDGVTHSRCNKCTSSVTIKTGAIPGWDSLLWAQIAWKKIGPNGRAVTTD
jgi:hypothetical protein